MRALVTGGGGFIGSNLAEALLKRGDDVVVLDDFSTGRRQNLRDAAAWASAGGGAFELIEGDVRDPEAVRIAVRGCEVVLHHAAIPSVAQSVADPLTSHQVNVDGTLLLLLAARDAGVRRFVFASSSAVYGDSPGLPKIETMPTGPISPYGVHKLAGEIYCRLFHQLYGLPTVALRYFNVFGPRQDPSSEYSGVISRFVAAALLSRPATIFGDGGQTRDFIFVDNVVRANLLAADAPEAALGQVYNVACGEGTTLLQLVELIGDLTGRRIAPRHDAPRTGDIRQSRADVQKAASALGFVSRIELREGLSRTLDWWRAES